jgi:hypothetical protein
LVKPYCCAKLVLFQPEYQESQRSKPRIKNPVSTDNLERAELAKKRPLRDERLASPLKGEGIEHVLPRRSRIQMFRGKQSSGHDEPFAEVQPVCRGVSVIDENRAHVEFVDHARSSWQYTA